MNVEYINPFINATVKVLKTMAYMDSTRGELSIKKDKIANGDISGIISLEGGTRGSIGISLSTSCALAIAQNMFGETYTTLDEDITDMVGEIINMISGEARRELSEMGLPFSAGMPITVTGKTHEVIHHVSAPIIRIPFRTKHGNFFIEACFESEELFEDAFTQKPQVKDTGKTSLTPIHVCSSILNNAKPFQIYLLKENSQITKENMFLFQEYIGANPGFDPVDYLKLEVFVCPDTYFSSNIIEFFHKPGEEVNEILEDEKLRGEILPRLTRMQVLGELPASFYSVNRNIEQALTAFELAMHTSNTLYTLDKVKFEHELYLIAEYALKAALLSKAQKIQKREHKYLLAANKVLQKLFSQQNGVLKFKALYQLTAIALYLGDQESAKKFIEFFTQNYRQVMDSIDSSSREKMKKLLDMTKSIWSKKGSLIYTNHIGSKSYFVEDLWISNRSKVF